MFFLFQEMQEMPLFRISQRGNKGWGRVARTKEKEQRSTIFERTYFLNGLFMSFLGTLEIEKKIFAKIGENIQKLRECSKEIFFTCSVASLIVG